MAQPIIPDAGNGYRPCPQPESPALPAALEPLREALAESIHDTWSAGRLAEGWRWGPERDDANKLHPCLVPYDQLPESEKEYDRRTAEATLRFILSRGFRVLGPEE